MDRKILPFAIHPRMKAQIAKDDEKRPEAEKVLKKEKTKMPKSSTTKAMKAHIIEEKPKKKEVREYFTKRVEELESSSDED
jgi:hypothetical protein